MNKDEELTDENRESAKKAFDDSPDILDMQTLLDVNKDIEKDEIRELQKEVDHLQSEIQSLRAPAQPLQKPANTVPPPEETDQYKPE